MSKCKYRTEIEKRHCKEDALLGSQKGYCIFHEELKIKDMNKCMKLFYDKLYRKETDFEGFILKDVDFYDAMIFEVGKECDYLNFNNAKFYGSFSAPSTKFLCSISFMGAKFYGDTTFNDSTFYDEALFDFAEFSGKTRFWNVDFLKDVRFSSSVFSDFADFVETTFKGNAFFSRCKFRKPASFEYSDFEKGGKFSYAEIDFAVFENAILKNVKFNNVNITNFKFYGANIKEADFSGVTWKSNWKGIWRKNILREDFEAIKKLKTCNQCSQSIINNTEQCEYCGNYFVDLNADITCPKCGTKNEANSFDCSNKNCNEEFSAKIENPDFSNNIKRAEMFKKAEDVYRNIKLNLQNSGDYQTAGEFYFNERIMIRNRLRFGWKCLGFLQPSYLFDHLYSKLCGYGERPKRVILSSLILVFVFAFFFYGLQAIGKQGSTEYNPTFLESLYFSIVTFTTLGYGDYAPKQTFQLLATSEAFIGAFMIALFVLVFGRKMLR